MTHWCRQSRAAGGQEFAVAERRRSQTRPTKGSGRPINMVTTLAGSGTAVTLAVTPNVSSAPAEPKLNVITFVNEYGVVKDPVGIIARVPLPSWSGPVEVDATV